MDVNLKMILVGASALPYDDAVITLLDQSCKEYLAGDICQKADTLSPAFVYGSINPVFKQYILECLKVGGYNIVLTDEVFCRLSEFAVVSSICAETDKESQALAATIVMNYMIVAKGRFSQIPNEEYVVSVYPYHISKYISTCDNTKDVILHSVYARFADKTITGNEYCLSEDEIESIRCALKESLVYRIERILNSEEIQKVSNPYTRVYMALKRIVAMLPYKYYDLDFAKILSLLIHESDKTKRKKIGVIVADILDSDKFDGEVQYSSSVILSFLNGEKECYPSYLDDLTLTVREFAIYLYFEMLTELIGK